MQLMLSKILAVLLALSLMPPPVMAEVRLEDDFYAAVNEQWLRETVIPGDMPTVGTFSQSGDRVEEKLIADFGSMLRGELDTDDKHLREFLKLYAMALDWETRNAQGAAPMQPYLDEVLALESLTDLSDVLVPWMLEARPLPVYLSVETDMINAQQYALYAHAPSTFLPDTSYYAEDNASGQALMDAMKESFTALLSLSGFDADTSAQILSEALAFDALLVPYVKTTEEANNITLVYNPRPRKEFASMSSALDLGGLIDDVTDEDITKVIISDLRYYGALDELVNDDTFPLLKSWLIVWNILDVSDCLSHDFDEAVSLYSMAVTGQEESISPQKEAYYLASGIFSDVVGMYYGRKYLGEDAKEDVIRMVEALMDQYEASLRENTWLSETTRELAISKLDSMALMIGYPDEVQPYYDDLLVTTPEDGGTVLSNIVAFSRVFVQHSFSRLGTEVNRSRWVVSADTVNALYSPMTNTIHFPAAILQAPVYSYDASPSANYGGIGVIIAHEMSHAFDPDGARFDEMGNYKDWWMADDYRQYDRRAAAMRKAFDGIPYADGHINGAMILSENIADAGGLRCAIEVVKQLPDPDLEAFFRSYATIWRSKATPQYESLLLVMDSHAPDALRVNRQVSMMDEFYDVFAIQEEDAMYLPPEERVAVW